MNRAVRPDPFAGRAAHPESTTYDVEDGMVKRALAVVAVVAVVAVMVAAALLVVAGCGQPPSHAVPHPSPQPSPCPPG